MTWLLARISCWRKGHDWRLMTADLRFAGCFGCGRQASARRAAAESADLAAEMDELLAVEEAVSDV